MEIVHRWNNETLYEAETQSMRELVLAALAAGAYLSGADLSGADLSGADLIDADLSGADLSGADLSGADLSGADLSGADLRGADLRGADLRGADLSDAYLRGADLSDADLIDAYLSGADLSGADLTPIRDDLWAVLSSAPAEVEGLRSALVEGRVDGSTYQGECACLVGTIAKVRGCGHEEIPGLVPNSSRPIEKFFLAIKKGDTPENSQVAKLVLEWVDQFLFNMRSAFGSKVEPPVGSAGGNRKNDTGGRAMTTKSDIHRMAARIVELCESGHDALDGLGQETAASEAKCYDCGLPYGSPKFPDLVIDHAAWKAISPDKEGNGLLCPACILERLYISGIECKGRFRSGPLAELDEPQEPQPLQIQEGHYYQSEKGRVVKDVADIGVGFEGKSEGLTLGVWNRDGSCYRVDGYTAENYGPLLREIPENGAGIK